MVFENFREDAKANTSSFYCKNDFGFIDKSDIEKIKQIAKQDQDTARLSLHNSAEDSLQLMLIYHPYKKDIGIKKYTEQSSIYILVEGEFIIEFYNDTKELVGKTYCAKDKVNICKIPSSQYYKMNILSDTLLFMEVRNGPFKRENQIYLK